MCLVATGLISLYQDRSMVRASVNQNRASHEVDLSKQGSSI